MYDVQRLTSLCIYAVGHVHIDCKVHSNMVFCESSVFMIYICRILYPLNKLANKLSRTIELRFEILVYFYHMGVNISR